MSKIILDGQLIGENELRINPDNRSFLYGDGLFESILVANEKAPLLKDHLIRLETGASYLQLSWPAGLSFQNITSWISQLQEVNDCKPHGRIKIVLFRKSGGKYLPETDDSSFMMLLESYPGRLLELNDPGQKIGIYNGETIPRSRSSNFKTTSALSYVLASKYMADQRYDNVLLLNDQGRLADATNSNCFIVLNNKILTPSLEEGPVDGVMRKQILALAIELGMGVSETTVSREQLQDAEEVFLTNSIQGIRWIGDCEGRSLKKEISAILHQHLADFIGL